MNEERLDHARISPVREREIKKREREGERVRKRERERESDECLGTFYLSKI